MMLDLCVSVHPRYPVGEASECEEEFQDVLSCVVRYRWKSIFREMSACRTFEYCFIGSVAAAIEWLSTVANDVGDRTVVKFWCKMKNFRIVEVFLTVFGLMGAKELSK